MLTDASSADRRLGREHVAGLDDLLEAPEVVRRLLRGLLTEELRDGRPERPGRRFVRPRQGGPGAPAAGRRSEGNRSFVLNLRAVDRPPREQLAGSLVHDLGLPL